MDPNNMSLIFSDNQFSNFSNNSFNVTGHEENEEFYKWALEIRRQLAIIFSGYVLVIVGTLGTIGNLLSIIVLLQPQMRVLSINILLIGQQFSDLLLVIATMIQVGVGLIIESINPDHIFLQYYFPLMLVVFYPFNIMMGACSRYFTVLVTIERYIAVCHPLRASTWLSPKRAIYGLLIVTFFSLIFSIPFSFSMEITYNQINCKYEITRTKFHNEPIFKNYFQYSQLVVYHLVPFTTLIILNAAIATQVKKRSRRSKKLNTTKTNTTEGNSLTFVLFAIVITFFLCNIVVAIWDVAFFYYSTTWPIWMLFIYPFPMLLLVVNSSVNFIFYCAFGTKFRLALNGLTRSCSQKILRRSSTQVISTNRSSQTTTILQPIV